MRKILISSIICTLLIGCTNSSQPAPEKNAANAEANTDAGIGIGPVKTVTMEETINKNFADQGQQIFSSKCSACHKIDERYVGPSLKGVTLRRKPEWIMNMILNPQEMVQKDPTAQGLLGEFLVQMTFQNITQDEARKILEYFRSVDESKQAATKTHP